MPPTGSEWLHEIKFDGYRAIASVGGGRAIIRTRTGLDWTTRFASLVEPLIALDCDSAVLDGEVTVTGADGRTDFGALQEALSGSEQPLEYYLFDLPRLDGEDFDSPAADLAQGAAGEAPES